MRYPRRNHREGRSHRSCTSSSIVNTTLTNVSENRDRDDDEEGEDDQAHVEGLQFLAERDMRSLHRHIPALGRSDVQSSAIRQHYYPEGGWGWVVVVCCFLCNCLTTGLLLSGGMLNIKMLQEFPGSSPHQVAWVTVAGWSVSLAASPALTHLCRNHSVRLVAVIGGLVMNLSFLFASFGHQLHQVFISYGLLLGLGCAMVRDTSSLILGQYFKLRRDVAEMWSQAGTGIGILVFSLLYSQAIGSLKWRLGLQAIQAVIILAFFLGLFFRPASLYHPQRDAISHIKSQKEKVKGVNSKDKLKHKKKNQLLNFAFLKHRRVRLFLVSMSVLALGIYTPLFYLVQHQWEESGRVVTEHLTLLQVWLGLATSLGALLGGLLTIPRSRHFYISGRLAVQVAMLGAAAAMFAIYLVSGYYGYLLSAALYGLCLGCLLYTSKLYCYNSVKAKEFGHVWSMVAASQAVSALGGIMVTGYINSSYSKTGYWFSILSVILATSILSLDNIEDDEGVLHTTDQERAGPGGGSTKRPGLTYDPEVSMNYDSKVDKYFAGDIGVAGGGGSGDMNGNFKLRAGDLSTLSSRKLSHSDPLLLASSTVAALLPGPPHSSTHTNLWEHQVPVPANASGGLRRQTTWHKLLSDHAEEEETAEEQPGSQEREVVVRLGEDGGGSLVIDQITSTV